MNDAKRLLLYSPNMHLDDSGALLSEQLDAIRIEYQRYFDVEPIPSSTKLLIQERHTVIQNYVRIAQAFCYFYAVFESIGQNNAALKPRPGTFHSRYLDFNLGHPNEPRLSAAFRKDCPGFDFHSWPSFERGASFTWLPCLASSEQAHEMLKLAVDFYIAAPLCPHLRLLKQFPQTREGLNTFVRHPIWIRRANGHYFCLKRPWAGGVDEG